MSEQNLLKDLFRSNKYDEIVAIWKEADAGTHFPEWDYRTIMNSCYKLKNYQDCIEVYRSWHKEYPHSAFLNEKSGDHLGWSLYHTQIKNFDFKTGDIQRLRKQIDYIFKHSSNTGYSPRWVVAKFAVKHISNGNFGSVYDNALALHYIDMVDPSVLSDEENIFSDASGKVRRFSSDKERWYSERTKLLLALKQYDECEACCEQALHSLNRFHSNNDSWFRYRQAKCFQTQGKTDEAREIIEQILASGFSHWCLMQFLFELEWSSGNQEKALSYGGACSLADPEHKMRVSFYKDFSNFLEEAGKNKEAMLHRRIVNILREENGWGMKSYQYEWPFTEDIAAMDKRAVLQKLVPLWREWNEMSKTFYTGTIVRILSEGKSGFIECRDDGNSYYFNTRDIHGKHIIPETGRQVRFALVKRLDRKKGEYKPNAVEISIVDRQNGK